VLFVRKGALLAQRFDMAEGKVVGNEVSVADGVLTSNFGAGTALSVSSSGIVAYRRGQTTRQLAWFDRSGRLLGQTGGETSELRWPVISAKGRVALQKTTDSQLWLIDTDGSTPTQFTFSPGGKLAPIWSPDEQWIAFSNVQAGGLRRKRSNGTGEEETLFSLATRRALSDWSPDGGSILAGRAGDIEVLSLEGKSESRPYLADPAYLETQGVFSPNGRWVAYQSNESGRFEIYVRPFPDPAANPKCPPTAGALRSGARTAASSTTSPRQAR
jgi:Tol biopolymer transport system component